MTHSSTASSIAALLAAWLGIGSGLALAQSPAYNQGAVGEDPNPNRRLTVERATPSMRVPVRTTVAQPLMDVLFKGYGDMVCASRLPILDAKTGALTAAAGRLQLRDRLLERLSGLRLASLQAVLQGAEKGERAEQFEQLFGVALPASSGGFTVIPDDRPGAKSDAVALTNEQIAQLNMGREVRVAVALSEADPGRDSLAAGGVDRQECLTLPQVDAAIAEAKRVYAAVIAAMEGQAAGKAGTSQPASGLQAR